MLDSPPDSNPKSIIFLESTMKRASGTGFSIKYKASTQWCVNVGQVSLTFGQYYHTIGSMYNACWVLSDWTLFGHWTILKIEVLCLCAAQGNHMLLVLLTSVTSVLAGSFPSLVFRFHRNKMFLSCSLVYIQYCGEPL